MRSRSFCFEHMNDVMLRTIEEHALKAGAKYAFLSTHRELRISVKNEFISGSRMKSG